MKTRQVAKRYNVCESWVRRLKQRRRELGIIGPLPPRSGRKAALGEQTRRRLREFIAARPDATLEEIRGELRLGVSIGCLWNTLDRMGLRYKKSRSRPASRIARTSKRNAPTGTSS
jgi:transposase